MIFGFKKSLNKNTILVFGLKYLNNIQILNYSLTSDLFTHRYEATQFKDTFRHVAVDYSPSFGSDLLSWKYICGVGWIETGWVIPRIDFGDSTPLKTKKLLQKWQYNLRFL